MDEAFGVILFMNEQEIFRFAQAAPQEVGLLDALFQMLPFVLLIMAIFYFMYQRPMQKEQDKHQTMLKGIMVGDTVVKTGKKSSITILKTSIKAVVQGES